MPERPAPLHPKVMVGFGSAVVVLAAVGAIAIRTAANTDQAAERRAASYGRRVELQHLHSIVQTAENARGRYLVTGMPRFDTSYAAAVRALDSERARVAATFAGDSASTQGLRETDRLLAARMALLDGSLRLRRDSGLEPAAAVVRTGQGAALMDTLRRHIEAMADTE